MMLRSIGFTLGILLLSTAGAGPLGPAAHSAADRDLAEHRGRIEKYRQVLMQYPQQEYYSDAELAAAEYRPKVPA